MKEEKKLFRDRIGMRVIQMRVWLCDCNVCMHVYVYILTFFSYNTPKLLKYLLLLAVCLSSSRCKYIELECHYDHMQTYTHTDTHRQTHANMRMIYY